MPSKAIVSTRSAVNNTLGLLFSIVAAVSISPRLRVALQELWIRLMELLGLQAFVKGARRHASGQQTAFNAVKRTWRQDKTWSHRTDQPWAPVALLANGSGKGNGKGKGKDKNKRVGNGDQGWDLERIEKNPFWWRDATDELCFELPMTPVDLLVDEAPPARQWWDVQKLAESDNFVAVCKPPAMVVITDPPAALWEESTMNFIHVAHQRYDMPSRNEPRQRGICHRLDCNTSGVQIFGKTWEAFQHFGQQNIAHRMHNEYVCLVHGKLGGKDTPHIGIIDVPMVKYKDPPRREYGSVVCDAEGSPAVSKYRVLRQWYVPATSSSTSFWGEGRWFTLVQMRILTGRTHQIRVHMAFIGHPLVGDDKYNPSRYEQDLAIVPRIFLHCIRMQFEDMDCSMFTSVSDVALDLRVALWRIHELATEGIEHDAENGSATVSDLLGLPVGFAQLLDKTKGAAPEDCIIDEQTPSESRHSKSIVQRSYYCGGVEESSCALIRRREENALVWKLRKCDKVATKPLPKGSIGWGPDVLWIPTELQDNAQDIRADRSPTDGDCNLNDASPDELGDCWKDLSPRWAWAHDGERQNGWLHLHAGGVLMSKWGEGKWQMIADVRPSLLLVTFCTVEHCLRLTGIETKSPSFVLIAKNRLGSSPSLMHQIQDCDSDASKVLLPDAPVVGSTRGWPLHCDGAGGRV